MGGFTPRRCESGSGGGEDKSEGCKGQNKAKGRSLLPVARIAFPDAPRASRRIKNFGKEVFPVKQDPKGKGNHPWKGATTGAILVGTAMAALSTRRARLKERLQKLVSAKRWFVATICILSVCALATSLLLAGQLGNYLYYRNYDLEVDLLQSNGFTTDDGEGNQLFSTESEAQLFHASYSGADGQGYSVVSAKGDSVIAPGTSGEYNVRLRNTEDVAVYYSVLLGGYLSDEDSNLPIPILVRMKGADGDYILGSENVWVPIQELRGVTDAGSLKANQSRIYTLEWKWPFENGNDAYDTLLGNGGYTVDGNPIEAGTVDFVLQLETMSMLPVDQRSPLQATFDRMFPALLLCSLALLISAIVVVIRYRRSDKRAHE